jgi:hypothetical protein
MLFVVIGFSTLILIHVIVLKIKIVKLVKFHVTSGVVTKLEKRPYVFKILKH